MSFPRLAALLPSPSSVSCWLKSVVKLQTSSATAMSVKPGSSNPSADRRRFRAGMTWGMKTQGGNASPVRT